MTHGLSQLGNGDELFSLSSTPSGASGDGSGDASGEASGEVDDGRLLAHVIRTPGGSLVGIGRGWSPKPGFFRLPPGEGTHEFGE